ncbi:MAG TPA: peptide-methionine (S)-S-oxide reductase MsrA [Candidatus Eisenbacteria bacterium]|jgi:peptide-methionine (S)-S-oxide reductase
MRCPPLPLAALIAVALTSAHAASGAGAGPAGPARGDSAAAGRAAATLSSATFAGGCFWCMETAFEGLPGVKAVISGYTGGTERRPTYELVSSKKTSHVEAVRILYDSRQISYAQLLDFFWHNVDPTDGGGQFCDHGPEYRSEIFYHNAMQQRLAEESRRRLQSTPQRFKKPIVTMIVPVAEFWPAEEYHQDYYKKDPEHYHHYRKICGRDQRLIDRWGMPGRQGEAK